MTISAPDTPWLVPLVGKWFVSAHGQGVVPHREPLVSVRIPRREEDHHGVPEHVDRRGLLGGQKLVGHPHRRLESRGLVAVNGEGEHDGDRRAGRDVSGLLRTRGAGVGKPGETGADLVEPRDVLRSGHDQRTHLASLFRDANALDPYPVAGCRDHRVQHGLLVGVLRVPGPRAIAQ